MRVGDLVQSNLFDSAGSGGYGLVMSKGSHIGYWNIQWAGYKDEFTDLEGASYEIHEDDLVVALGKST